MKHLSIALLAACILVGPARAEDTVPIGLPKRDVPVEKKTDLSRPVTLTGYQIQALLKAAVLAAHAQNAAQAAAGAEEAFSKAVTVPDEGKATDEPKEAAPK